MGAVTLLTVEAAITELRTDRDCCAEMMAPIAVTPNVWQEVAVAPSDLMLNEDAGSPPDPDGKLDVENVAHQIEWLQGQGFVDKGVTVDAIIAKDFVKPY